MFSQRARSHQGSAQRSRLRGLLAGAGAVLSLCLYGAGVQAAVVTLNVTPTFAPASGIVTGYRAYRACDTTPVLIGPAASGQAFSFQHDTAAANPTVSIRAYNEAGEGTGNCATLSLTLAPPGATTTTYVCELDPSSGGTCVAQ